ncbi:MAG: thiamine ABC transporter substrate-binding protein [Pseudomonadota bacterium]
MKKMLLVIATILGLVGLSGPVPAADEVVLMTHDSFNADKEVIKAFEKANSVQVKILKSGDAGAALNQAILSKKNPLADVFFGVDNTFMTRALQADIFEPYNSPLLAAVPDKFKLDDHNRLLPVDYGDVCLNFDKKWFKEKGLAPPQNLDDLLKPEYADLTVVENPATSSPGLAFLLTTVGRYGEKGYLEFWKKFKANGGLVVNGWEQAYWGHFSAASKGSRPIVVSYASSPPVEVVFSEKPITEPPSDVVVADGSAFRQIEFVGLLKGAKNPEQGKKLIDFLLDKQFQEGIPLQMYVFPVNSQASLPEVFEKWARLAPNPVMVDPTLIAEKREAWIEAWTETVLR